MSCVKGSSSNTEIPLKERIAAGAILLDQTKPDWYSRLINKIDSEFDRPDTAILYIIGYQNLLSGWDISDRLDWGFFRHNEEPSEDYRFYWIEEAMERERLSKQSSRDSEAM